MTTIQKRLSILPVVLMMLMFALSASAQAYVNFAEALQKSLFFYDAEKCGFTGTNRLEWRGPCHLEDGKIPLTSVNTNLTDAFIAANRSILDPDGDGYLALLGGYHDAGDHVQFGLPQGYTASTLGWGLYEFKQAFIDTGNYDHMIELLKYFTDFFLKCAFKNAAGDVIAYCYQTGDGSVDHAYWGPPELQDPAGLLTIGQAGITYPRPAWFAYPDKPASDQCSEAAASLALMYLNYKDIDLAYANNCLATAKALYAFSVANRGLGDSGGYYGSAYDHDELSWAAVWLYTCTGTMTYIDDIMAKDATGDFIGYFSRNIGTVGDTWVNIWVHCWDVVWGGTLVQLAKLFPTNVDYDFWARWNIEFWSGGQILHDPNSTGNGTYLQYTPGGYGMINTWGSARYNTAAQLCGLIYAKNKNRTDIATWANGQMTYIMGSNPMNKSYIVGYGPVSVQHPHHRAAHGSFTNSMVDPANHRHTLWGALAGGPDGNDIHVDSTIDYVYNEVACDYNAGFVGALAGLYDFFGRDAGHLPLAVFPPKEPDIQQFAIEAKLEQENVERTQVTMRMHAVPCHAPIAITGIKARYYFNISELLTYGQTAADVRVEIYYDEHSARYGGKVVASGPLAYDAANNIYYIEFEWTVVGVIGSRELQFGLIVNMASDNTSHWDPTNDYSRTGITAAYAATNYIPVYHNGTLVVGQEPNGTISPTSTTITRTATATTVTRTATATTLTRTATATRTSTTLTRTATPTRTSTTVTRTGTATTVTRTATATTITRTATSTTVTRTGTATTVTRTATATRTATTITRTATATSGTGCTCAAGCTTRIVITPSFIKEGVGTFCFEASSLGSYINSWNLVALTVNGVNVNGLWVAAAGLPAKIDGLYYVYYNSTNSSGHFEATN